jgi:hypothetical protein
MIAINCTQNFIQYSSLKVKSIHGEINGDHQLFIVLCRSGLGLNYWSPNCASTISPLGPWLPEGRLDGGPSVGKGFQGYFSHGNVFLRGMGHWRELDMR